MKKEISNQLTHSLTELINTYHIGKITSARRKFLNIGYDINTKQKISFCLEDFREKGYSDVNFRQYIHKLHDMIDTVTKSNPVFYKLKGIILSIHDEKITHRTMGEGIRTLKDILLELKYLPPMIHDIKLKFKSENLHRILLANGCKAHPQNKQIRLDYTLNEISTIAVITVYPKSVQIHISNSYNPIMFDSDGILRLSTSLGSIFEFIHNKALGFASIPHCLDWIIYHYHFNKDQITVSGKSTEITVADFNDIFTRYYKKTMHNGTTVDRLERIETSNTSIKEMMDDALD